MKLSIAVQMHESRVGFRPYLVERLGEVPFCVDEGAGFWPTCREAWLAFDPDAVFHVVVQDDAIVCDDFRQRAEERLVVDMPHSFYWGARVALRDVARAALPAGYVDHQLRWSVAVCLPTRLIADFIAFGDAYVPPGIQQDQMKRWLLARGLQVRYVLPSLVDHRDGRSVIGDRESAGRNALFFIDRT